MSERELPMLRHCELPTANSTQALGERLARCVPWQLQRNIALHLQGDLGAGKTSLAQALLRALGVQGAIPSPSYTLVEPYDTSFGRILHIDLYRLQTPQELDDLGARDEWLECALRLVEWPQNGGGSMPRADLHIGLQLSAAGRAALLTASSDAGATWLLDCARSEGAGNPTPELVFSQTAL